jgi:hypothetical protein
MSTKGVAESYSRIFESLREIAEQTRTSAKARLVWFAAISGFAILNGKKLWDSITVGEFVGGPLVLLALPWAIVYRFRTWFTLYSKDIAYTLEARSTCFRLNPTLDTISWILFVRNS